MDEGYRRLEEMSMMVAALKNVVSGPRSGASWGYNMMPADVSSPVTPSSGAGGSDIYSANSPSPAHSSSSSGSWAGQKRRRDGDENLFGICDNIQRGFQRLEYFKPAEPFPESADSDAQMILNPTEDSQSQKQVAEESHGDDRQQRQDPASRRSVFLTGRTEISLAIIEQYQGRKLADAERELGVSRSTIKRRCRELGINRWQYPKRNKVDDVQPNPKLGRISLEGDDEAIQESETCYHSASEKEASGLNSPFTRPSIEGIDVGNDTNHIQKMLVKATYKVDTVIFHLWSNSGFQELLRELKKRFKQGKKGFKIKYEEKEYGEVTIACTEDLQLYKDSLVSAGQTRMDLKIS